jgi:hypothetical protein
MRLSELIRQAQELQRDFATNNEQSRDPKVGYVDPDYSGWHEISHIRPSHLPEWASFDDGVHGPLVVALD